MHLFFKKVFVVKLFNYHVTLELIPKTLEKNVYIDYLKCVL